MYQCSRQDSLTEDIFATEQEKAGGGEYRNKRVAMPTYKC